MTAKLILSNDEIVKAIIEYVENNSAMFQGGTPEGTTVKINVINGVVAEAVLFVEEKLS